MNKLSNLGCILRLTFFSVGSMIAAHASSQSLFTEEETAFVESWIFEAHSSSSEEELVAGAIVSEAHSLPLENTDFYSKVLSIGAASEVALIGLLNNCHKDGLRQNCDIDSLVKDYQLFSPNNAVPLVYAAFYHIRSGNDREALDALKKAAMKQEFDSGRIKTILLLTNVLKKVGYPDERINAISGLYSGGSIPVELHQHLLRLCQDKSEGSLEWRDACFELGQLMEDTGKVFFSVRVGLALQKNMLSFSDEDSARLMAVERRRAYTHRWRALAAHTFEDVRSVTNAPDEYYQDLFKYNDEIYARNQAFQRIDGRPDP